jgi:hypothetical protein
MSSPTQKTDPFFPNLESFLPDDPLQDHFFEFLNWEDLSSLAASSTRLEHATVEGIRGIDQQTLISFIDQISQKLGESQYTKQKGDLKDLKFFLTLSQDPTPHQLALAQKNHLKAKHSVINILNTLDEEKFNLIKREVPSPLLFENLFPMATLCRQIGTLAHVEEPSESPIANQLLSLLQNNESSFVIELLFCLIPDTMLCKEILAQSHPDLHEDRQDQQILFILSSILVYRGKESGTSLYLAREIDATQSFSSSIIRLVETMGLSDEETEALTTSFESLSL